MGSMDFLSAGRSGGSAPQNTSVGGVNDPRDPNSGGTRTLVQSSGRVGFLSELGSGSSDVMQGRLSLLMLDTLVLGIVAFYIWTHRVQGGG